MNPITKNVLDTMLQEVLNIFVFHPGCNQRKSSVFHLLYYNYLPSFDEFSIICHVNKMWFLELKESLLIMKDRPPMNRNKRSAPLSF